MYIACQVENTGPHTGQSNCVEWLVSSLLVSSLLATGLTRTTYKDAISALRLRIDPQNRVSTATDFRHALQAEEETVADYVKRIERLFQIAYGQLLRYDLMRSPAVSGLPGALSSR